MCPAFKTIPKDSQWERCVSMASHAGTHSKSSNGENAIDVKREISSATEHSLSTHAGLARTNYPIKIAERYYCWSPSKADHYRHPLHGSGQISRCGNQEHCPRKTLNSSASFRCPPSTVLVVRNKKMGFLRRWSL